MGGQAEQKRFRLRIAVGSLSKTGLLSGLLGFGATRRAGAGMLANFDSTAPDAAMARKVEHSATIARSTAQRYFRSRVSTDGPRKSNTEANRVAIET